MTLFGTSAKFIDAVQKAALSPRRTHRLTTVRTIASTGSPLAPESFDFVYEQIKPDVHLASISGGTDIVGCFALGNPTGPVWRGEIQMPRPWAGGRGLRRQPGGRSGARRASWSAPGRFRRCRSGSGTIPTAARYHAAYFAHYPGVWRHGDYVELTEHDGLIIYGRSDATLNPGGVRIGTAEIYRQVEQIPEVVESLVVGQQRDHDERIVLFVRLRDGVALTDELRDTIRRQVRERTTPAPRPRAHRPGAGDPADQERQDRRAGGARRDPRARSEEPRSAGQPGGAGVFSRSGGVAGLRRGLTATLHSRPMLQDAQECKRHLCGCVDSAASSHASTARRDVP